MIFAVIHTVGGQFTVMVEGIETHQALVDRTRTVTHLTCRTYRINPDAPDAAKRYIPFSYITFATNQIVAVEAIP